MTSSVEIRTLATPQDLSAAAAEEVVRAANEAVAERGRFAIALSGGSTPRNLHTLLATNARTSLPWDRAFFFWGDERHVPPTDPESNYRMADETLLSKIPVAPAHVFRIPAENPDAAAAAGAYEQTLRKFFALEPGQFPRFDLILLGMGPDGHTASLFPGTAALEEKSHLVVANWVEKFKTCRITLTLPVLNAARCVVFLVSGTDKAPALHAVLQSDEPGEQYPAKLVRPTDGKLIWLVDRAAASGLKPTQPH
ncbi:6-phosphogluconolactonase [Candidatus Sulfotelmatobacter kueseliae]|uniref:6-phosphogluconolactonase n=1 Tax=Candidatus Sulfotelmatobacter kueseliae TaxID=2042962 RepID=A0A2U3L587_9BACT|nr:6-phosphogluconolactonase [Candidatus Sulfotelmatobacter kueseliae]